LGYTEDDVLRDVIEMFDQLHDRPCELLIRHHPKEDRMKFIKAIDDRPHAAIDAEKDYRKTLERLDIALGMSTMALYEAALIGKEVISYQPGLRGRDMLKSNALGWSMPVYEKGKLKEAVLRAMERLEKGKGKGPRKLAAPYDGKATERVLALIDNMLAGGHIMRPRVVCIIQTRMGSTRLPGKVLKPLAGKPVLWHIIRRLKTVKLIDEIVIATTTSPQDDIIVEKAEEFGASWFRGSESDVLARYHGAAKQAKADVVIRITSDCPVTDPNITESMLREFLALGREKVDYLSNFDGGFPRGLDAEIFWFDALEKIFKIAEKPYEREHVTPYIYQHPEEFRIRKFKSERDNSFHRWTLDTPEDYDLLSRIYDELYDDRKMFYYEDVLKAFERHPDWLAINSHVRQKKLGE